MLPHTLMAIVLAGNAAVSGLTSYAPERHHEAHGAAETTDPARYESVAREVTNWRSETADTLSPKPLAILAAAFGAGRPVVTRCVKLNNYWCIKSAKWNGEIGTDPEGHVGFATAGHGADAAALLLKRYYLDFNRKSALDIVRRWAPAECNLFNGLGGLTLAVKGIGGTVRAKYLAANRVRLTAAPSKKGGSSGRVSLVISIGPQKAPQFRVPDIAAGMGEKPKPAPKPEPARRPAPKATASTPAAKTPAAKTAAAAAPASCAPDEARLQNYAARMVETLKVGPKDDLKLFEADGTPGPNLAPIMLAMSSFELGLLRPDPVLVEDAIRRAAAKAQAARQKAEEAGEAAKP